MRVSFTTFLAILSFAFITKAHFSQSTDRFAVVRAASGLTLRSEPASAAKAIATVPFGHFMEIEDPRVKSAEIDGRKGFWARVKYLGNSGYAFDGYFETSGALATVQGSPHKFLNKKLHEGLDCGGLAYSEYGGTLKFTGERVEFHREGAARIDCRLKAPGKPVGYDALYSVTKTGVFKSVDDRFVLTFTSLREEKQPGSLCVDATPLITAKVISETYTAFPVQCKDHHGSVPGLIVPGLGHTVALIWVENQRSQ